MKKNFQNIYLLFLLSISFFAHAQAQTLEVSVTIVVNGTSYTQIIPKDETFDLTTVAGDLKNYMPLTITLKNTGSSLITLQQSSGKYFNILTLNQPGSDFTTNGPTSIAIGPGDSQSFTVSLAPGASDGSNKSSILLISYSDFNSNNNSYSGYLKYTLGTTTAVTGQTWDSLLRLYPNPSADGHLFISSNDAMVDKVVISDLMGFNQEFISGEFITSLKGLLLVKVYTNKGIVSKKILVQE